MLSLIKKHQKSVSSSKKQRSTKSKSKILHDSVTAIQPLLGFVDAEDLEDAFRVAYVDFQNDFMEDLKELFCTTFENKLSQIMSEIASIKQQQLRQSDISDYVDSSSNGVKQSTHKSNVESDEIQKIKVMVTQLLSENQVLRDQLARVTYAFLNELISRQTKTFLPTF